MRKRILWICETAAMLALLICLQWVGSLMPAPMAKQLLTGTMVNCVLAVTVLVVGLSSGATVALISPFVAFLLGIGPKFLQLIPLIAVGNLVLILVLGLLLGKRKPAIGKQLLAWMAAAFCKFGVLYLLIVVLALPALVKGGTVPAQASATIAAQFSWPQLVTALCGSAIALSITPVLRKALHRQ